MLRVDGACTSVSSQAAAGAAGTESGGGGESDDGGDWEMMKLTKRDEFIMKNYELGVGTIDGGIPHSCRVCAAIVIGFGDALERHVAWHKDQAPSVTINLTTAWEDQFAATDVHETARRK